jgi:hypothetical protein
MIAWFSSSSLTLIPFSAAAISNTLLPKSESSTVSISYSYFCISSSNFLYRVLCKLECIVISPEVFFLGYFVLADFRNDAAAACFINRADPQKMNERITIKKST